MSWSEKHSVRVAVGARSHDCVSRALVLAVATLLLPAAVPFTARAAQEDTELPEAVEVDLEAKDGALLKATFYPGIEGKETVPVIMLHMYMGGREEYRELALALQKNVGCAVLIPDLRGHGDSTRMRNARRQLEAESFRATRFQEMVEYDLEACKRYLIDQHNEGNLNIDRLCVVGAEMGAAVAVNWAEKDWSWPPLATGKQGQDVKLLVLLSPEWSFKGLQINRAVAKETVRSQISVLIMVGAEGSKQLQAARRLYRTLEPHHPEQTDDTPLDQWELLLYEYDTSLQGTNLLGAGLDAAATIGEFIKLRCKEPPFPWKSREGPL